ncbi:MAG: hypothetical protein Fur0039_25120 [Rhodocyclaceae bacterium]
MTHTLVAFLGKGRESPATGYRTATYRFPAGSEETTPFFGLALTRHLAPDELVLLGTGGSMWDVLIEHLSAGGDEELRVELMDAVAKRSVDQALLDRVRPLAERGLGRRAQLRIIPYGRDEDEQRRILGVIAAATPKGEVSFDLTHAFRHLGMVGLLSAFMLERVGKLTVRGLWYGALDMTEHGITPVLRLDGLIAIQRWVDALDRFDATGDYGVFAPLLVIDGVPEDKARCLQEGAFHERTFNLADAARKLRTFLPVLDAPLQGAASLFQSRLAERLAWVREDGLAAHQRRLAYQYLGRDDFVRASVFGWEAVVTQQCVARSLDPGNFSEGREPAIAAFEAEIRADQHEDWKREAYWRLKNLRNALAHGNPPRDDRVRPQLKSRDAMRKTLDAAFKRLLG